MSEKKTLRSSAPTLHSSALKKISNSDAKGFDISHFKPLCVNITSEEISG